MTLDEFKEHLKDIPLRLNDYGKIRTADEFEDCPICAVARKLGIDMTTIAWDEEYFKSILTPSEVSRELLTVPVHWWRTGSPNGKQIPNVNNDAYYFSTRLYLQPIDATTLIFSADGDVGVVSPKWKSHCQEVRNWLLELVQSS